LPSPSSNSIRALLMIAFILLVADIPLVWADGELGPDGKYHFYARGYWYSSINIRFYWETYDSSGQHLVYVIAPTIPGRTYTFTIVHAMKTDMRLWKLMIQEGVNTIWSGGVSVYPYDPRDHQAFVETTTATVCISGSHFSEISYFDGRSRPYWYTHVKMVTPPYYVTEFSHYEFYAGGGG